jgi:enamine deaminase RidA (YjgF/YER057c/UK114 family)
MKNADLGKIGQIGDFGSFCAICPSMSDINQKVLDLGLTIPAPPQPGGCYLPYRRHGNLLVLAGVICIRDGVLTHEGQVGAEQTVETAFEAARVCALNVLAGIQGAAGSLEAVEHFVYMGGYVNAVAGFAESPAVINGASQFFVELFGEAGQHARAAVAVAGLPKNATVEIQVNVALK